MHVLIMEDRMSHYLCCQEYRTTKRRVSLRFFYSLEIFRAVFLPKRRKMRKTDLNTIENKIRNSWCRTKDVQVSENAVIMEFIDFVEIVDCLRHTIHREIIRRLYFTGEELCNMTEVCYELFVDERTLYRYRKSYTEIYQIIEERHKSHRSNYVR